MRGLALLQLPYIEQCDLALLQLPYIGQCECCLLYLVTPQDKILSIQTALLCCNLLA